MKVWVLILYPPNAKTQWEWYEAVDNWSIAETGELILDLASGRHIVWADGVWLKLETETEKAEDTDG